MNYRETTGKSIQSSFVEFHKENPQVYTQFKKLAFDAINKGKKKISFKMIMNVVRWDMFMKPTKKNDAGERFKINDAFGSRYARLFVKEHPKHATKVELRALRS